MNTSNLTSKIVRVDLTVTTRGFKKSAGSDDLLDRQFKTLAPELFERAKKLAQNANNINSRLKDVCGHNINHPQGGIASLDDNDKSVEPLKKTMKDCLALDREASLIAAEIKKFVDSGEFDERVKQCPELKGKTVKVPSVGFSVQIAVDVGAGQSINDIIDELKNEGLYFPAIYPTRMIHGDDEKMIVILKNIADLMGKHHRDLQTRCHDLTRKKPVTKDDVIKANYNFAHSLDDERGRIRAVLGNTPQAAQVEGIIDKLLQNGNAMIDVFEEVKLYDGSPASEAVDVRQYITHNIKDDNDLLADLDINDL